MQYGRVEPSLGKEGTRCSSKKTAPSEGGLSLGREGKKGLKKQGIQKHWGLRSSNEERNGRWAPVIEREGLCRKKGGLFF